MRWSDGRFVGALLGLWLVACGGVSQQDFPAAYSEAACRWQARCGLIRDEGACIRDARASYESLRVVGYVSYPYSYPRGGSLRAGRMRFDEDRAEQCVTRLRTLSCESGESEFSAFFACDPYVGQRQEGQECLFDPECVSGFYCDRAGAGADVCAAGTCRTSAGPGEPSGDSRPCAPGLWEDAGGLCQPLAGEGGACSSPFSCEKGLFCASRICKALAKEGAACVPDEVPCLSHLNCGEDGRCHRLANLGEACTFYGPGLNELRCKRDLLCVGEPNTPGVCGERLANGASCVYSWDCQFPLTCARDPSGKNGTCQPLAQIGATCGGTDCVLGAWCDASTGLCVSQGKKLGAECDSSSTASSRSSCVPGFICAGGQCAPSLGGTCEG